MAIHLQRSKSRCLMASQARPRIQGRQGRHLRWGPRRRNAGGTVGPRPAGDRAERGMRDRLRPVLATRQNAASRLRIRTARTTTSRQLSSCRTCGVRLGPGSIEPQNDEDPGTLTESPGARPEWSGWMDAYRTFWVEADDEVARDSTDRMVLLVEAARRWSVESRRADELRH